MPSALFPLGEWLPDRPEFREPCLTVCRGVIPAAEGYEPIQQLAPFGNALTGPCLGAVGALDSDGAAHMYAGDATKLYELEVSTWTDRSRVGGYSATSSTRWRFASYGDRLLATNGVDPIQYIDMSTGAVAFADLPFAPKAQHIVGFGEFVVLGATESDAQSVRWSAIGDSTGWTIGVNQSDEQAFPDGGAVTGLVASDVVYVFQQRCIRRMVYVNEPAIFNFDLIEAGRGCIEPGSLCQVGRLIFFLAEDGFYAFDGAQSTPIGAERIDEWFKDASQRSYWSTMTVAADPRHKIVAWAYAPSSAGAVPTRMLLYNWAVGRWAEADPLNSIQTLVSVLTLGISLDDLTGSLDAMTISLDDPVYLGGALTFGAFVGDNRMATFSSAATLPVTLETGAYQLTPGARSMVSAVEPILDLPGPVVSVSTKERHQDAWSTDVSVGLRASGAARVRAGGRLHKVRIESDSDGAGAWSYANGLRIDWSAAGRR